MKIVKILGIIFVLMVIGALVLLPKTIDVKVEKTLDVDVEVVYSLVWNMQNWSGWSPWDKMDSTRQHSYIQGNIKTRIGGEDRFTTTIPEYSNGKHVIVDAKIDEYIIMDVYLDKVSMEEPVYTYRFDFESISEVGEPGTKVTWSLTDTAAFFKIQERFLSMFLNENFSKLFTEGLDNLESYAIEQEIFMQFQHFEIVENKMTNAIVGEILTTNNRDSIEFYYKKISKYVFDFIKKNNIITNEPPLIIFQKLDKKSNTAIIQYGFNLNSQQKLDISNKLPNDLKIVDINSPLIVAIDVLPLENDIEHYFNLLKKYLNIKNYQIIGPRMERYLSNLDIPGLPRHLVIILPIMKKEI